jgi:hypothetical protein
MKRTGTYALLSLAAVIVFGALSLIQDIPQFLDPCLQWEGERRSSDTTKQGAGILSLPPGTEGPCARGVAYIGKDKVSAFQSLLGQGFMVIGGVLGIWGILRLKPLLTVASATILLVDSIVLFISFAPITLLGGIFSILATRQIYDKERQGAA